MRNSDSDPDNSPNVENERSLPPMNLQRPRPPDESGFLIVRLKPGNVVKQNADLLTAAREAGVDDISATLESLNVTAQPLITSVPPDKLRDVEKRISGGRFAPSRSLADYWRLDARKAPQQLDEIEERLRRLPNVDLVYREKTITDPSVMPDDDPLASLQEFHKGGEVGVNLTWFRMQDLSDGAGMHFIDLEQSWLSKHDDLPVLDLILNDNHDGIDLNDGNHGTAVLGILAGVDNTVGIIGMTPNLASVRVVSHWNRESNSSNVADALTFAAHFSPRPDVILLEVQSGNNELPVETEDPIFNAIRVAVASGIIIVEAAGNGNQNLDQWNGGELNRSKANFRDSGAILVGAGKAKYPHRRSIWEAGRGSNYGSRVDCYAWGDSIISTGYGDLNQITGRRSYTKSFRGTSAAAPIIAGCALLLQGFHLKKTDTRLSPAEMRELLSDPTTGTKQGGGVADHIGVMPDLKAIVQKLGL